MYGIRSAYSFRLGNGILLECSLAEMVKVKLAQSCLTLCDLVDYTVEFSRPE